MAKHFAGDTAQDLMVLAVDALFMFVVTVVLAGLAVQEVMDPVFFGARKLGVIVQVFSAVILAVVLAISDRKRWVPLGTQ